MSAVSTTAAAAAAAATEACNVSAITLFKSLTSLYYIRTPPTRVFAI